jgi:hypothetical protein
MLATLPPLLSAKTEDAIDGECMIPESALELLLRRGRRVGFIKELGMDVPYYELPCAGIRLIAADIRAVLKREPPLHFPDCLNELRRGFELPTKINPDIS